jgi:hypothetical protein
MSDIQSIKEELLNIETELRIQKQNNVPCLQRLETLRKIETLQVELTLIERSERKITKSYLKRLCG